MEKLLLVERRERVCTLVLNRPERGNALTPELLDAIRETLDTLAGEDEVRAVVLRGAGDRAFCSGYDLAALPVGEEDPILGAIPFERALDALSRFPYPVIAMVNGHAFGGGCDLAVACDMRVAAADVRMGMVPARLGVVYPPEGLRRFIRTVGLPATREMFFTGRIYEAARLRELGLVDHLVPRSELETFAHGLAEEIAANAPLSLKGIKRILNLVLAANPLGEDALAEALTLITESFRSEDLAEGRLAFLEKRKPVFRGR